MDAIDKAIGKQLHISKNPKYNSQKWSDFEKNIGSKKIIMFGLGAGAEFYFKRFGNNTVLDIAIDNNPKKQGWTVETFVVEAVGTKAGQIRISASSALNNKNLKESVVIIAGLNAYEDIAAQLESKGITEYYVLLIMEANERKLQGGDRERIEEKEEIRTDFARRCCAVDKIERKKVFFRTNGKYGEHEKYITEALLKLRSDLDIVWALSDLTAEIPKGVRKIWIGNWKHYIYEMETAGIWVSDIAIPEYVLKRPGQIYIQTKHWASITLKKFYLDAVTFKSVPERIANWERDGRMIDYIITGSEFDEESCKRGFGFQGEFLRYGSPRSDALFQGRGLREKVYQECGLQQDARTLLYAPTYRFDKIKGKNFHVAKEISLDFENLKTALEETFGGVWYILLRLHPTVADAFFDRKWPAFVRNVSHYEDSQELVAASDMLISDFSSIMFEPAFVKKPVFLFTEDLQAYLVDEYELLIPYDELPFPLAQSNEELTACIRQFNREEYEEGVIRFLEHYGVHEDGHASERTAVFISELIDKNTI